MAARSEILGYVGFLFFIGLMFVSIVIFFCDDVMMFQLDFMRCVSNQCFFSFVDELRFEHMLRIQYVLFQS